MPPFRWNGEIFRVGLTGAIGSGKSTAAEIFRTLGATVISADDLAREAVENPSVMECLRSHFGNEIFMEDGRLDRRRLATMAFGSPEGAKQLNACVHPEIRRLSARIQNGLKKGTIYVYDAPLLFEASLEKDFDLTVMVSAPLSIRKQRSMSRSEWTEEEFEKREENQMPQKDKEAKADIIIKNDSTLEELTHQIESLVNRIQHEKKNVLHN